MKIGILVPHVFAQQSLLNDVIFAPVHLAISLADKLSETDDVFLFTPGHIDTKATNINVKLDLLNEELAKEDCTLQQLITTNPLSFISLSKQIQAELTAKAFEYANSGKMDILHIYMCEDEIPLYFSNLVNIPVVFTHHDPFNFYRKYRVTFPKLKNLNYISISKSQKKTAPEGLKFVANVYNGIDINNYDYVDKPNDYFAFLGRVIRVKGADIAIQACVKANVKLKIAGKHYSDSSDSESEYWSKYVQPHIDGVSVDYVGYLKPVIETNSFLGNAKALLFPSQWDEPFGLVMIEALACGTPVIAFDCGAVREIIQDGINGFIVKNEKEMIKAINKIEEIDRKKCRESVKQSFTTEKMVEGYKNAYLIISTNCN